jgi:hypothetical protein
LFWWKKRNPWVAISHFPAPPPFMMNEKLLQKSKKICFGGETWRSPSVFPTFFPSAVNRKCIRIFLSLSFSLSITRSFFLPHFSTAYNILRPQGILCDALLYFFAYTTTTTTLFGVGLLLMSATMQFIYIHTMYPLRCVTWSSEYHDEWKQDGQRASAPMCCSFHPPR